MKVLEEKVRHCEEENEKGESVSTDVLEILYVHYKKKGRLLVKNFSEELRPQILAALKLAVQEKYPKGKEVI